jgi:hypothetical protein
MLAQTTHYTPLTAPDYGGIQMSITAVIYIDGVEQANTNLELAVFVDEENGECRATKLAKNSPWGKKIYSLTVKGQTGEHYTYRVYDHSGEGQELDLDVVFTDDYPQLSFLAMTSGGTYGSAQNPWHVYFTTPSNGFEKDITGYGTGEGHWYLIASPVGEVAPSSVGNMVYDETESDKFDLYCFDQSQEKEWLNYKGDTELEYQGGFSLEPGKGYLYASKQDTTLVFNGTAFEDQFSVTDTTFALAYDGNAFWKGWNLVGNPFSVTAYIGGRAFYVMNEGGTDVEPAMVNGIPAMEGIFVVAEGENETVTFSTEGGDPDAMLALNLSRDSKVVDRAVVSFGQERTLPKFQLNPNHTKVYIPQESRDYAVVTAGEMGEMPVCFKAERNGRYTLDFTAQAVSFAYLHLIDNKTGKDVDLLESPAYSFDALTTDYASRFKLVFATGNATEDNFAFCSNGNWIISNDGEATLQVIDVTGRILSSETVSGCVSKSISAAPGVYMLRLINGDNMKVQKVVVK